ncbi:MAG: DUF368 domain-containing protein [Pirellulaceae bacterium]|nr:DUF368 domain-containing protein [Pirellulaceae bacterium]
MHKTGRHEIADLQRSNLTVELLLVLRGVCMGAADVVPGISGGTVALILGIYQRLVTAISHCDLHLLGLLKRRRWREVAEYLDLRFLCLLVTGIAAGFVLMTLVVSSLLESDTTRPYLLASFFGMVLASAWLVARMIHYHSTGELVQALCLGLIGAVFAWWLTTLTNLSSEPTLPYIFFCGLLAACAMILPGISGAMVLLILGVYGYLTHIPHQLLRGEQVVYGLVTILVFGSGCAISLISVSKFLRWLLTRHQTPTMGLLCGFMFGALAKLWPFQRDLTPDLPYKEKVLQPMWPGDWSVGTWSVLGVLLMATLLVLIADWWLRQRGPLVLKETT